MKKILVAILIFAACLCFSCGKQPDSSDSSDTGNSSSSTTSTWSDGNVSAVTSEEDVDSDDGIIHLPDVPLR